jgi:hypothetical protein
MRKGEKVVVVKKEAKSLFVGEWSGGRAGRGRRRGE